MENKYRGNAKPQLGNVGGGKASQAGAWRSQLRILPIQQVTEHE